MTSRFTTRTTPKYDAAVAAVGALFAERGWDGVSRAVGDAVVPRREGSPIWPIGRDWERWKRSRGVPCVWRLVGRPCRHRGMCNPPGLRDHAELWLLDGKPIAYITHEYEYTTDGDRVGRLLVFAAEHGIHVRFHAESHYFPGRTVMVVLTKQREG